MNQQSELGLLVMASIATYVAIKAGSRWLGKRASAIGKGEAEVGSLQAVGVATAGPDRFARLVRWWIAWPAAPWLQGLVRFLYYVGVPYAALLYGVVDLRSLGVIGGDPFISIGMGVIIGGGAWALLVFTWWWRIGAGGDNPLAEEIASVHRPLGWGRLLLDAVYLQAHWAFYRSWLLGIAGPYYGVLAGFLLTMLEWFTGWSLERGWTRPGGWEGAINLAAVAWTTTILFLLTNNLWLCMVVHGGIWWGLLRLAVLAGPRDSEAIMP